MDTINWTELGILGGTFVPLLALPLALIGQYIKTLHEQQIKRADDLKERIGQLSSEMHTVTKLVHDFERHYTTREDWLRELEQQRAQMDKLTTLATSIQIELKKLNGKS